MKYSFTKADRSYEIGWHLACAIEEKCHFFIGVFKQSRKDAHRNGWLSEKDYVRGFLSIITKHGRSPRQKTSVIKLQEAA